MIIFTLKKWVVWQIVWKKVLSTYISPTFLGQRYKNFLILVSLRAKNFA